MAEIIIPLENLFRTVQEFSIVFPGVIEQLTRRAAAPEKQNETDLGTEENNNINTLAPIVFRDQDSELSLDPPPVISVSLVKNVVTTPLAGRDFTVKEIISADDYELTFRGFLLSPGLSFSFEGVAGNVASFRFPEEQFQKLVSFIRANRTLKVQNNYLRKLGIERLVIKKLSLPTLEGLAGIVPYEFTALSDEYVELTLND